MGKFDTTDTIIMKKLRLLFITFTLILSLTLSAVGCFGGGDSGDGDGGGDNKPKEPVIVNVEGTKGLKY